MESYGFRCLSSGRLEDSMSKNSLKFGPLTLALLFVVLSFVSASAQTVSGTLRGTITDSNGAAVPNATVTVTSTETGLERTATASGEGVYNFAFLPIGSYRIVATRTDFNKVTQESIRVTLNETTVINIKLDPSVSGEVTVTDERAPINTTDGQIAQSLTSDRILERPVANQGNFLTLAETFTGYQENPTTGQNNSQSSSGSSVNFNGTGTRGATFQINGVNNDDSSENQNRQGASLATIKEFQVISNNFTAEFGRGYGAVVLVQTLSGTNNVKGSAYWYNNNQALNARNHLSFLPKAVFRRNQFGGVVGLPIVKDKFFTFLSIDEVRNSGANNITRDIPTAFERNPANWFQLAPQNDTPANRAFIQSVMARFDGLTPNSPSRSPRAWEGISAFSFPANDYSARVDWNATTKDTLWARWQYTRQVITADDVVVGERADQNNKQQNYGLNWTHIFSNNVVGEFRYGLGLRNTLVNIAAGNDTPILRFTNPFNVSTGTIIGNAGSLPIQRYQTDHQFVYNLSWIAGNHFMKMGTDIRRQNLDDLADSNSRGSWNFSGQCNGTGTGSTTFREPANNNPSGWLQLINGCVTTYTKGYGPFYLRNRIGESNFYFEDNWKIFPNLTLNLGVRYEFVNAPKEADDLLDYGFGNDSNNWEPRLGFAWSPDFGESFLSRTIFGKAGESSIRAGYGIYHGRLFQSVFSQNGATVRFNPPNAFTYTRTGAATTDWNPFNLTDPTCVTTGCFSFTPGTPATARAALTIIDPNLEMPYTQQWNVTFERQIPWASAIRLSYTGNRGIGLLKYTMQNLPFHNGQPIRVADHPFNGALRGQIITPAADLLCAGTTAATLTITCPNVVAIGANEYSARVPRTNERRPNPLYTTNLEVSNGAWSYYHALQAEWSKRLTHNINFQAAYTFSKAIDTTSEASFVGTGDSNINGPSAKASRGFSRFHTPHRFTLFGTVRSPFFDKDRSILGHVLGGWEASMVFKWAHGTPFTVTGTGIDFNLDGFAENRPVVVDPSVLGRSIDNPTFGTQLLPQSAFRTPTSLADFQCCILGRNTFFVDGTKNVDFGFTKRFLLPWERHSFVIRADMFNAFNHVQWGFPNATYTSTLLGSITTTATSYAPRNIQVSMKYSF